MVVEAGLMSEILEAEDLEAKFMEGLVGELEVPTLAAPAAKTVNALASKNGSTRSAVGTSWEEVTKLARQRLELGKVVARRLERCVEVCDRALAEARGATELRASVRTAASAARSALEADEERRRADAQASVALERMGRPVETADGWAPSDSVSEACARARAQGRNEALGALAERERLREKCAVYKARVAHLEAQLKEATDQAFKEVPLDDDDGAKERDLERRLAVAERRLKALVGTERAQRLQNLETELEERRLIIEALRAALDEHRPHEVAIAEPESPVALPPPANLTPASFMPSTSVISDFDDASDSADDSRGEAGRPSPTLVEALPRRPPDVDFPVRLDRSTFIV